MRRIAFAAVVGVVCGLGLVLVAEPGRASLYSPEDPFALPVGDDGKAKPLPFDEFKRRLAVLTNAFMVPKLGEKANPDREKFLEHIRVAEKKLHDEEEKARAERKKLKLDPAELSALAVNYLRVGELDKALNLLGPLTAERRPSYFVFTTLGHIHAARGEWAEALRYHQEGLLDTKMPEEVKGLSKVQRDWWDKLDKDYVTHFYHIRKDETEARRGLPPAELDKANETEDVLPLFPLPGEAGPKSPVRFVNDAGEYQPGVIAAAEKAKLPPDAFAVVQQLLLWFPTETRLYWLLAELYASVDDLDSAIVIFDECAWSRQYGNRKILMDHRNAIRAAIDARPKPQEEKPPISMQTVMLYFGVVAAIGGLALVRTLLRRRTR